MGIDRSFWVSKACVPGADLIRWTVEEVAQSMCKVVKLTVNHHGCKLLPIGEAALKMQLFNPISVFSVTDCGVNHLCLTHNSSLVVGKAAFPSTSQLHSDSDAP